MKEEGGRRKEGGGREGGKKEERRRTRRRKDGRIMNEDEIEEEGYLISISNTRPGGQKAL